MVTLRNIRSTSTSQCSSSRLLRADTAGTSTGAPHADPDRRRSPRVRACDDDNNGPVDPPSQASRDTPRWGRRLYTALRDSGALPAVCVRPEGGSREREEEESGRGPPWPLSSYGSFPGQARFSPGVRRTRRSGLCLALLEIALVEEVGGAFAYDGDLVVEGDDASVAFEGAGAADDFVFAAACDLVCEGEAAVVECFA